MCDVGDDGVWLMQSEDGLHVGEAAKAGGAEMNMEW